MAGWSLGRGRALGLVAVVTALLVFAAACGAVDNDPAPLDPRSLGPVPPIAFDPPRPAADFELQDQYGNPFHLAALRDEVVVLFFGYTTCPDVCPTTLAQLHKVKTQLGDNARQVHFVFVTVDPARDTPARLQTVLERYDDGFIGLSGEPLSLQDVWQQYNVVVEYEPPDEETGHYWVNHSARIYLIDPAGMIPRYYTHNFDTARMAADIEEMLR